MIKLDRNQNKKYVSISMKEEQLFAHEKSMLSYNKVPDLLPVSMRYVDELVHVEYDTGGMQQISSAFMRQSIDRDQMVWLIDALSAIQEHLLEYMLSPDGMILDPEYMFTDPMKERLFICYQPGERDRVEKNIQPLLQYILENVDYNDQTSVRLAYALYHINDETGDIISAMKKCVSDGAPNELAVRSIDVDDALSGNEDNSTAMVKQKRSFFHRLFNRDSKRELLLAHANVYDEEEANL